MVLGAGVMQLPLIKKIREMGHFALVVGIKGNYPGLQFANQAEFVDFNDADKVVELGRKEKIDAVWTCGLDMPVKTMSIVSERLGLPGISASAGEVVSDKMKMKECFMKGGVRTARFIIAKTLAEGKKAFEELNKPVMFKMVDGQGSTGIVKVCRENEIEHAYECIQSHTKCDYYIVEEFISGEKIGIEAFVQNGKLKMVMPNGEYVFHGITGVPLGHYVPYGDQSLYDACRKQLEILVKSLKLGTCALNIDAIVHNEEIYILEIGARCGATMLAETVSIFYGFDYYEKMILAALGEEIDLTPQPGGCPNATMTLMSDRDGTIVFQENRNPPDSNIITVQFDKEQGSPVRKFSCGIDRIGHVIVKGKTLEQVQNLLQKTIKNIVIDIK